ncbi:MAG: hypothetical protein WCH75_20205, partial [Candidatus Binatia bacterium]
MQLQKTFRFKTRTFQAGAIAAAFAKTVESMGVYAPAAQYSIREKLGDGSEVHRQVGVDELATVCDRAGQSVAYTSIGPESGEYWHVSFSSHADMCFLHVDVGTPAALERVRSSFVDALALEELRVAEEEQTGEEK